MKIARNSTPKWPNVLSDMFMAPGYSTIALTVLWFIRKRRGPPFHGMCMTTVQTNTSGPFTASNGNLIPKAGVFYNRRKLHRGPSDLARNDTFFELPPESTNSNASKFAQGPRVLPGRAGLVGLRIES